MRKTKKTHKQTSRIEKEIRVYVLKKSYNALFFIKYAIFDEFNLCYQLLKLYMSILYLSADNSAWLSRLDFNLPNDCDVKISISSNLSYVLLPTNVSLEIVKLRKCKTRLLLNYILNIVSRQMRLLID